MTRTRRLDMDHCLDAEPLSNPTLLAERLAAQARAGVVLHVEQDDRARSTGDELAAGSAHGTHDGAEDFARLTDGWGGGPAVGDKRRFPDPPLPAVERAERAGIGPRQRTDKVIDRAGRAVPVDAPVRRPAAGEDRFVAAFLPAAGALPRQEWRQQLEQHLAVGGGDVRVEGGAGVVGGDGKGALRDR